LKILSADFVTSAAAGGGSVGVPRDGIPQFALAGRSNVGKSSLLNALCRRKIARTSAAPGKTRLANVYRVHLDGGAGPGRWDLYLVDLPGYGYARGGAGAAAELAAVAEGYFRDARPHGVFLLVDARHPGLESDVDAARWMDGIGVPLHLIATKIDKLTRSERARNLKALERTFGTAALPMSATDGEGLDELWKLIASLARGPAPPHGATRNRPQPAEAPRPPSSNSRR
jgi:GTP-binding protein